MGVQAYAPRERPNGLFAPTDHQRHFPDLPSTKCNIRARISYVSFDVNETVTNVGSAAHCVCRETGFGRLLLMAMQ